MTSITLSAKRLKSAVKRFVRARSAAVVPRTRVSPETWGRRAQEAEFHFHKQDRWRHTDAFRAQSDRLFRHFGFEPDDYTGKTVVDLGAGSQLRTKFFNGARLVVIEPLADRFLAEIERSDLRDATEVHSKPAEQLIESLVGTADLVVSINVLDHCYDFEEIVSNIRRYLKSDGLAFLSFDMHAKADDMHPLSLTKKTCAPIFARSGLAVERLTTGLSDVNGGSPTWGHGPYALNYWLRPTTTVPQGG
ncbi:MAG TPA: methyltransferase domain-containing protein [Micromonosporaceae bacterium]|nr:methyltransferase domain-containing protein [Micromonosporaceae bacterium]